MFETILLFFGISKVHASNGLHQKKKIAKFSTWQKYFKNENKHEKFVIFQDFGHLKNRNN
jgi:hypothetical protein